MKKLLLLLALAACGDSARNESADVAVSGTPASAPVAPVRLEDAEETALQISQPTAPAPVSVAPAMMIRTGTARVQVDSVEAAMARVQRMAQQLGGYVGNTSVSGGDNEMRSAQVELKVPAARFDQAVSGLRPIGKVESVQVEAQDVGEEYVDLSARNTNARRLEERLLGLLATRTGKLEDVLAVERELARVRQEIDTQEGRLRYLRSRVAVSTLNVTLHEALPVVGGYPGSSPIGEAFRAAWRNFVGFTAGFIASLGVLIPLGLLLAAILWLYRRWRRANPRAPRGHGPAAPPPGAAS